MIPKESGILTSLLLLEVRRMFSLLYYSDILPRGNALVNRLLQENFNIFRDLSVNFVGVASGRPHRKQYDFAGTNVETDAVPPDERCSSLRVGINIKTPRSFDRGDSLSKKSLKSNVIANQPSGWCGDPLNRSKKYRFL